MSIEQEYALFHCYLSIALWLSLAYGITEHVWQLSNGIFTIIGAIMFICSIDYATNDPANIRVYITRYRQCRHTIPSVWFADVGCFCVSCVGVYGVSLSDKQQASIIGVCVFVLLCIINLMYIYIYAVVYSLRLSSYHEDNDIELAHIASITPLSDESG